MIVSPAMQPYAMLDKKIGRPSGVKRGLIESTAPLVRRQEDKT